MRRQEGDAQRYPRCNGRCENNRTACGTLCTQLIAGSVRASQQHVAPDRNAKDEGGVSSAANNAHVPSPSCVAVKRPLLAVTSSKQHQKSAGRRAESRVAGMHAFHHDDPH